MAQDFRSEKAYNESLINCHKCPTGMEVLKNPEKFSDEEIEQMKKETWALVIHRRDFAFFRIRRIQLRKKIIRYNLRKAKK